MRKNKRGKGGLLFGIIMGVMLGILFAPRKGKELIRKIKKEISKGGFGFYTLKDSYEEMGRDIIDVGQEIYENTDVQKQLMSGKIGMKKIVNDMSRRADQYIKELWKKIKRK